MNEQITILLIEDNRADARLVQETLLETTSDIANATLFKLTVTDRLSDGLRIMARGKVDVVLLDLSLPDSEGLNTLLTISKKAPALPVIVMTGLNDEAVTIGALQAGAQDYLVKGEFDRNLLMRAIRYAIQRKRGEEALRASEESLRESQKQLQMLNEFLEQKVEERTREVRNLASELTLAEQRERHRISHILHDDLQQRLYAIQMQLEVLGNGQLKENAALQKDLAEIRKEFREVLGLARNLSIDLSPPILRDEGLTQAIGWLATQMEEQYGLQVELQAEEDFSIPDEEIQVLLFNCVRELLFNIVKHAGVKQAFISLQRSKADLRIEVRDSGKGFDVSQTLQPDTNERSKPHRRSFGLPMLRRRLSLFGGRVEVKSKPGDGTQIILFLPVYTDETNSGKPQAKPFALK